LLICPIKTKKPARAGFKFINKFWLFMID